VEQVIDPGKPVDPVVMTVTPAETELALRVSPVARSRTSRPETLASPSQFGVELALPQLAVAVTDMEEPGKLAPMHG